MYPTLGVPKLFFNLPSPTENGKLLLDLLCFTQPFFPCLLAPDSQTQKALRHLSQRKKK